MKIFTDQLARRIEIQFPPKKIISLVPSQTELLFDLGLDDELIAVTKFCVHPAHIRKSKQIIGGTKNLRIDEIKKLNPDLIIANKEENDQVQIEELSGYYPVWISDIKNFEDALDMILRLGEITDKKLQAEILINKILVAKTNFQKSHRGHQSAIPSLYFIWKDPYLTVGGDTFISNMLEIAGFKNIYTGHKRYPQVEIGEVQPELIFLSSEPYPFKEKHVAELQSIFPGSKIILVDGEMFSWYGSRLLYCFDYFSNLHSQLNNE